MVLHIDDTVSIVLSAGIALLYTMFGGLVAVAYTDVVQIIFIVVSGGGAGGGGDDGYPDEGIEQLLRVCIIIQSLLSA